MVNTSQPWSARLLVASASFTAMDQSPVNMTLQVMLGLTERAPIKNALILRSTCGIGLAATNPSLPLLLIWPAITPLRYWHSSM